jgi:hypothetical protein
VFTRIPPAGQSSATSAMKQGQDKLLAWRKAEQALGALSDRIRKRYFHGVFNGPSQMARFTEDDEMTALDRVLALAVVTGKDVSEPVVSDTSAAAPLIQPPENLLSINDPRASQELAALPAVDKARVNAYLDRARAMRRTNPAGAAQFAIHAAVIAQESGAHHLARHIKFHVQALAGMGNSTNAADDVRHMSVGGKTVSPRNSPGPGSDNPNARLSAVGVLLSTAGSSAGSSAGKSPGSITAHKHAEASVARTRTERHEREEKADKARGDGSSSAKPKTATEHVVTAHVAHLEHLHVLHKEHVAHLEHLHSEHVKHLEHLETHPAPKPAAKKPVSHKTTAGKTIKT